MKKESQLQSLVRSVLPGKLNCVKEEDNCTAGARGGIQQRRERQDWDVRGGDCTKSFPVSLSFI